MKKILLMLLLTMVVVSCGGVSTSPISTASASNCSVNGNCPEVTIFWKDTSTGVLYHTLYRSTTSGGPYTIVANNLTGGSYVDRNVKRGEVWYYVATSSNSVGPSKYSNELRTTP